MGNLKQIDTNNYVIKSDKIKVFPCVWRDSAYDKHALLNTEYNLSHIPSADLRESYIISNDGTKLIAAVCGYRFEISGLERGELDNIHYLWIKTCIPRDETGVGFIDQDRLLSAINESGAPSSTTSLDISDTSGVSYFYGLGFSSTTDPSSLTDATGWVEIPEGNNPSFTIRKLEAFKSDGTQTTLNIVCVQ